MKKIYSSFILAFALTSIGVAQVTIDDFSTLTVGSNEAGSWTGATSVSAGVFTVGAGADNSGTFLFVPPIATVPINATALNFTQVSVTARIDGGNLAPGFLVILFDGNGNGALFGTFSAATYSAGFTTQTVTLAPHANGGLASDIQYYGIAGTGTTDAFRMSFDAVTISAAAVPEPSTYAMIAGVLAFGFVAWRRRSVSS